MFICVIGLQNTIPKKVFLYSYRLIIFWFYANKSTFDNYARAELREG